MLPQEKWTSEEPRPMQTGNSMHIVPLSFFKNFRNTNGGSIFKAYNGTKADTLSFKNSRFENSYRGLNLSYDKDVMNFYNANVIILENSVFKDIQEAAVNYIRKTPIIDIPGGKLVVKNCVFRSLSIGEQ